MAEESYSLCSAVRMYTNGGERERARKQLVCVTSIAGMTGLTVNARQRERENCAWTLTEKGLSDWISGELSSR